MRKEKTKAQLALEQMKQQEAFDRNFNRVSEFTNAEELEPLEIRPFDPQMLRGLNFHEQII